MKLFFIITCLLMVMIVSGQTSRPSKSSAVAQSTENCIQISPAGYIVLPRSHWAFMVENSNDAWLSQIEPLDGGFKVMYSAGTVTPFDYYFRDLETAKVEVRDGRSLSYSVYKVDNKRKVVAVFAGANFIADLSSDDDIPKFLDIVFRYHPGRSESGCFSANVTRSLRKFFERRAKLD